MRLSFWLTILIIFLSACRNDSSKSLELQQFSDIEVLAFKKKNVEISTLLRFYNDKDESLSITYAECDIMVNGKDVGTFIKKQRKDVPGQAIFELPISVAFKPEDAFLNLDYGFVKIKSDVVSEVAINGYLLNTANGKEEKIPIRTNQLVLFTNNSDLSLDEHGQIQGK